MLARFFTGLLFCCALTTIATCSGDEQPRQEAIRRVAADIEYLASDALEGRGVETAGIELAADRILDVYRESGLKPVMPDGSYRQPFEIALGTSRIGDSTSVILTAEDGSAQQLKIGSEFQPLRRGGEGQGHGELVFVGYGITSDKFNYDDYANVDVEGRVVVMIRREPQQGVVNGAFLGTETSTHAYIDTKLRLAKERGVAGIIFVNDPFTSPTPDRDELTEPSGFGTSEADIPFVHVKQSVIDSVLRRTPLVAQSDSGELRLTSLSAVSDYIDRTLTPVSQPLGNWSAEVRTDFDISRVTAVNLIGTLEGAGDQADETIIVGAHYDHLGRGGYGSRAKSRIGEIHNGADDNASGTAALLELVRRLTAGPPPNRRLVFICFSGEERGLLGSRHYVQNPVYPLASTVTMLNYDMIGTLRQNRVEVNGVSSAAEFRPLVQQVLTTSSLNARLVDSPFAGSDHLPFYRKDIPVMFYFTGITSRYHTPDDDYAAINVPGVVSVTDFSEQVLRAIDQLPEAPQFQGRRSRRTVRSVPYLGVVPNLGADADEQGISLQSVRPDTPAAEAGFQTGDVIVQANGKPLDSHRDLVKFLEGAKPGDLVDFEILRRDSALHLKAKLGQPR